jgi:hypothetical protein
MSMIPTMAEFLSRTPSNSAPGVTVENDSAVSTSSSTLISAPLFYGGANIWQIIRLRAQSNRRLAELIAYCLAFLEHCAQQTEAESDVAIFQRAVTALKNAIPPNL